MGMVKLKGMIKDNPVTNFIAEGLLDAYTIIRRGFTGSYTKYKEDKMVLDLLKEAGLNPETISYADIGANNFRRGNNTYLFATKGAKGVLVEADPFLCKALRKKRAKDVVENCAIGIDDCESMDFYVLSLPTRNSMDYEQVKEQLALGLKLKETIKIPCVNINTLFAKHNLHPDYMSIDIEGLDFRVLKTLDFKTYPIKVIVAEMDEETIDGQTMDDFMVSVGYEIAGKTATNVIYKRK